MVQRKEVTKSEGDGPRNLLDTSQAHPPRPQFREIFTRVKLLTVGADHPRQCGHAIRVDAGHRFARLPAELLSAWAKTSRLEHTQWSAVSVNSTFQTQAAYRGCTDIANLFEARVAKLRAAHSSASRSRARNDTVSPYSCFVQTCS